MKRLEAEVLEAFEELGGDAGFEMASFKIGPRQFLGLELNRRAVAIAQLVLWIGFFQWQRKTTGKADTNERPLLPKSPSIVQQDAVLAYDEAIPRKDPDTGEVVTIWDGITTKIHPITGNEVPDDSARKVVFDYTNPRRAEWPAADVIVGNPPFIGASPMREALGDGYVESLRKAWKGDVPDSADFVMFWWRKAAELVRDGKAKRFGFITTNSIHQTFNRRVIEPFLANDKKPLHLEYAIPDHPWVDSADGAAVRIAMTVAARGKGDGILAKVATEQAREDGENDVTLVTSRGSLAANLQTGADVTVCGSLEANSNLSNNGVILGGKDFEVTENEAKALGLISRRLGSAHIRRYMGGNSLTSRFEESYILDLYGLPELQVQDELPEVYQWIHTRIRPKRLLNKRKTRKENWWLFNECVPKLRRMLAGLPRFIGTTETAKHRMFSFIDGGVMPDHMVISVALSDAFFLGILSSMLHRVWSLSSGGTLEDRPRYNKSRCFDPFPFPALVEGTLKQRIRDLGERLDAHRKRQQELHPDLTLTGLYNVLEAVRAGRPLNAKEKAIHDKGLVSILKQIHDELDTAVLEAYGWQDLPAATISSFARRRDSAATSANRRSPRPRRGIGRSTGTDDPLPPRHPQPRAGRRREARPRPLAPARLPGTRHRGQAGGRARRDPAQRRHHRRQGLEPPRQAGMAGRSGRPGRRGSKARPRPRTRPGSHRRPLRQEVRETRRPSRRNPRNAPRAGETIKLMFNARYRLITISFMQRLCSPRPGTKNHRKSWLSRRFRLLGEVQLP
jgi:hypothetical protein